MPVRIITYDLNKERDSWQNDRDQLLAHIKATWNWAKLSESSYAIETNETATAIRDALRQYLDDNDNLYVITLTLPWNGWGPKDVNDFLIRKLGPAGG